MSYQNWGLDEYRGGWDFGGQERRDQAATLALFYAKRGERNLSYCLYLRPFGSVNRLTAQSAPMEVVGSRYLDFESILRKAVERLDGNYYAPGSAYMHLVALSAYALPILGAGLIGTTDEEWRDDFLALAPAVRLIVAVPSARPGTLWELSQIAQNTWWQKTLYMMPESVHARDEQAVAAADWEKARKAAGKVGADLPPYDKNGAIFKLGPSGSVLGTRRLRLTQRFRRVSYLRRVINELCPL